MLFPLGLIGLFHSYVLTYHSRKKAVINNCNQLMAAFHLAVSFKGPVIVHARSLGTAYWDT